MSPSGTRRFTSLDAIVIKQDEYWVKNIFPTLRLSMNVLFSGKPRVNRQINDSTLILTLSVIEHIILA
jgi:hypothetical protein